MFRLPRTSALILAAAIHPQAQQQRPVFDVASIRPASPDVREPTNLDLDSSDYFRYTGGTVTASGSLINYLIFAYKMRDRSQADLLYRDLPAWAKEPYTLRATADFKPDKDQLRLMVQSLLAERFQLKIHTELRQLPVYTLAVDHSPAPGLTPAPDDGLCARPLDQPKPPPHPVGLPRSCQLILFTKGEMREARISDYTMDQIAGTLVLASRGALDPRPVLNHTGLKGSYDLDITFLPLKRQSDDSPTEEPGATFEQALKQQAGLKLIRETGSVPVYVIDRLERPTEN